MVYSILCNMKISVFIPIGLNPFSPVETHSLTLDHLVVVWTDGPGHLYSCNGAVNQYQVFQGNNEAM